ncbi:MAG: hypothetical protein ACREQ5_03230 [Candidatus Dormibacteria bacterium]
MLMGRETFKPNPQVSQELLLVSQSRVLHATEWLNKVVRGCVNDEATGSVIIKIPCLNGRFGRPEVSFTEFLGDK